jgi:hypothetical protein
MAPRLILPTDRIECNSICGLIYGQPGSKKTSLAQTAKNPITFAFDPGISRAYGRKAAYMFESWQDVLEADTAPYDTIVIDTIGMCLDSLAAAIVAQKIKGTTNPQGGLSKSGYGALKNQFAQWSSRMRQLGKSLVFLAHEKVLRDGEEPYYCPDIVGGSYNNIMNIADMVGYLHHEGNKQVLSFRPTDTWMAKIPPTQWGDLPVPLFEDQPHFLANLIDQAKEAIGKVAGDSAEVVKAVEIWEDWLGKMPDIDTFNTGIVDVADITDKTVKRQAWALIENYARLNHWKFNRGLKKFEPMEVNASAP